MDDPFFLYSRNVLSILSYFRASDVAHNFFVTRGSRFGAAASDVYDTIRVIVWAREPTFGNRLGFLRRESLIVKVCFSKFITGVKEEVGFNPALCELAGHLLIKGTCPITVVFMFYHITKLS